MMQNCGPEHRPALLVPTLQVSAASWEPEFLGPSLNMSPFFMVGHNPTAGLFKMCLNQPWLILGIKYWHIGMQQRKKKKKNLKYFENYLCLLLKVEK